MGCEVGQILNWNTDATTYKHMILGKCINNSDP